jgi:hypothetical protein
MRTRTIKLIIDKTSKKIARETLRNDNKIKDLLRTIARDPDFKDYALLFSTGSAVGGLLVTIFIKNNLATSDQVEALSNKLDKTDQKIDELSNINATRSLDRQDEAGVERLSNKIVESLKNQGLIPQEGKIKTDVVESVNNSNELEQENKKLKKDLSDKNTTIRNQQIGLIGVTALLFAAFLFRPSKALEIIETITNDN